MKLKKVLRRGHSSGVHWVGNGFPVHSVFNYMEHGREMSPFLMLDYAAPHEFAPGDEKRGVAAHPHKGFETVTVVYQGELEHRDSSGVGGVIGPGDVQWMTAGNGIVHEEFHSAAFTRHGGTLQMAQLWVNLPARHKSAPAGYQSLLSAAIPVVSLPDDAGTLRVIAGEHAGRSGAARTFTPIQLWDVSLRSGKRVELAVPDGFTTALLMLDGEINSNDQPAVAGELVVFERAGKGVALAAGTDARLLLMAGEPIDEPIAGQGPFVMNSREELRQAFQDFQLGRMGRLDTHQDR